MAHLRPTTLDAYAHVRLVLSSVRYCKRCHRRKLSSLWLPREGDARITHRA